MEIEVLAYILHVHRCGSRECWPMASEQGHFEKAGLTCLELVWVTRRAGNHDT